MPAGKADFDAQKLTENLNAIIDAVVRAKPSSAKGRYLRSVTVSATMSSAVPLDVRQFASIA